MSVTVTLELQGRFQAIGVKTADNGVVVDRRVILPGHLDAGVFVPTDLTAEPDEIRALAKQIWTPDLVRAWLEHLGAQPPVFWDAYRVTARQFKLQLFADNLLDQVESWVATQGKAIQLAYDNSGTFVRDEPMMQTGFVALGFSAERIDKFFADASKL
ncbi:hypothetical protein ACHMW7_16230 [Aminobacter sp. UC22_36]|uniref:hypothetical protein n=1 Tax=Aminobacter sp. UC22_36 TaxID=3374549 RepID=UPI0037562D6C